MPANLNLFSRRHPDARAVRDLDAVLVDPAIEAVVIATPPQTHHALVKRALEAGKHVLVEKPSATRLEDAHDLAAVAAANNRVLMPGHTFIYSPAVNTVRDLIRDGVIGDVHFITSSRMNLGKYNEDGVVCDLAPHDLSILLYWLEQPVVEVAVSGSSVLRQGVPETAFMTLTFAHGQTANVQISWLAPRKVRQMIVVGSQRMVQYDDTASDEPVRIYDRGMDMLPPTPANFGEHQLIYRTGDVVDPPCRAQRATAPGAGRLRPLDSHRRGTALEPGARDRDRRDDRACRRNLCATAACRSRCPCSPTRQPPEVFAMPELHHVQRPELKRFHASPAHA